MKYKLNKLEILPTSDSSSVLAPSTCRRDNNPSGDTCPIMPSRKKEVERWGQREKWEQQEVSK